jgi:hypothetical protein
MEIAMSENPSRCRRTSARRLTPLLLAAVLGFTAAPALAVPVAFTGSQSNDTPPPTLSSDCAATQVLVSFTPENSTSAGTSNFGDFGASMRHCITLPPVSYSGGQFTYEFDLGDTLFGTYSGAFALTDTPLLLANTVNFIVTGGTGRFEGATGAFTGTGTLDRSVARPLSQLELSGTLDLQQVPEPTGLGLLVGGAAIMVMRRRRRRAHRPA